MASRPGRPDGERSRWLLDPVNALPIDRTGQARLNHFTIFLLMGLPLMLGFAVYHLARGNPVLGGVSLAMGLSLGLARVLLRRPRAGLALYRINAALFAGMLLYMLALGGEDGSKSLWLFTFPLITTFLLGRREGTVWSAALLLAAAALLWGVPPGLQAHAYPRPFALRFALVFLFLTLVAHWFEFLRQHHREGQENERQRLLEERERLQVEIAARTAAEQEREALILELREALSRVKLLSGLLPICASCKKIRDEQGAWLQMEAYVTERSDAQFSHGFCPECARAFRAEHGLPNR